MKSLLVQIFGSYEPITYTDANGVSVIPDGLSGVDWVFLVGAFLFGLTLYCVFRLIGGFTKK